MVTVYAQVREAKNPESTEWPAFFKKYWGWLLAHARADIHEPQACEDICQTVLIKVARALPEFEYDPEIGSFRGWLLIILEREVCRYLAKRKRDLIDGATTLPDQSTRSSSHRRQPQRPPEGWPKPLDQKSFNEEVINRSLEQLRAKITAEAFDMFRRHWIEGESTESLAKAFARTANAVYTSNSKSLKAFRPLFKKNLLQ